MLNFLSRFFFVLMLLTAGSSAHAIEILRMEPAHWWTGMKNPELQIMVYGPGIAKSKVTINYPGVTLRQTSTVSNPNYLFLYLTIGKNAKAGNVPLRFNRGTETITQNYPLKPRTDKTGALGFDASDVLYLITPDRFANGNPANDDLDSVKVNRERPNSRHGGDLAGIATRLDYLKELGVSTIWLNPVQENRMRGGSYHGYAITDYYAIDPRFGSNEEFKSLVKKLHDKGMKMVMDMVLNHCGSSHWWMKDLPSIDWINNNGEFLQTNHATVTVMDIHAAPSERRNFVDGWFTRGMPDLNQRNTHLATYLIQNTIWWIEEMRIDGIRQDTYSYLDYDFLARWCKAVEDEYPSFNIVGETWYNKASAPAWWQQNSVLSQKDSRLRTVMNFSLTFITQTAFDSQGDSAYLTHIFEDIVQDFLYPDPYNMLIFLDNHDMSRFHREGDKDLKRYKQGFAFLATMRGIPQIYYGSEILMTGTKQEGDGRLRKDFPGGWHGDQSNQFAKEDRSAMQNEAWEYLQKLLQWRRNSVAITEGKMVHYAPRNGVYVYGRMKDDNRVLVLLNGSRHDQKISMDRFSDLITGFSTGNDVITSQRFNLSDTIMIPAKGQLILELKK